MNITSISDVLKDESFKYEKRLTFNDLNNISKWFKLFDSLDEVYDDIVKLMDNKQINIISEENAQKLIQEAQIQIQRVWWPSPQGLWLECLLFLQ